MSTLLEKRSLDAARLRADFPILGESVHGRRLVYLDNAATTQKPRQVLDRILRYYTHENANVHRGVHLLSERATEAYEGTRETVRRFINAKSIQEVIFVRGCTEGLNLVAHGYGRANFRAGDEVIISAIEHHSNIVPWQMLRDEIGIVLRVVPSDLKGQLDLEAYEGLLNEKTRLVSIAHISNALGTINPLRKMIDLAHARGIPVLVDGAQGVPHMRVDVAALDCDFYAFSGHKMFAPTGTGVLYGKKAMLEKMRPFIGGGDMILSVSFEKTRYNELPYRFEAGTPNIEGVVGLGAAIEYLESVGMEAIAAHEHDLLDYATRRLGELDEVRIIGTAEEKAAVISFVIEGVHPHDVGTILDQEGIAIRTGHHCAQPIISWFGVPATSRASFALYNSREDVDALVDGIRKVLEVFRP